MHSYPEPTLDGVTAWLAALPPVPRARLAAVLASRTTVARCARIRTASIHEATRTNPAAEIARQLGVTRSAVANAINEHNRAHRTENSPAEGDQ